MTINHISVMIQAPPPFSRATQALKPTGPSREVVEHNRARHGDIQRGSAAAMLGDVDKAVAQRQLLGRQALPLVAKHEGSGSCSRGEIPIEQASCNTTGLQDEQLKSCSADVTVVSPCLVMACRAAQAAMADGWNLIQLEDPFVPLPLPGPFCLPSTPPTKQRQPHR
jgi:hypothetical protein